MYVVKIKRKCGVRGCRNTESFAVSRTREQGNSVIICKDCLEAALAAVENYIPSETVRRKTGEPPALFFNNSPATPKPEKPKSKKTATAKASKE